MRLFYAILYFSFACLLSGCELLVRDSPAPVTSKSARNRHHDNQHTVKSGETLYEIAFKYGLDYRDLAKVNHLAMPYKIYPGQHLALTLGRKEKNKPLLAKKTEINLKAKPGAWVWPARGQVMKTFSEHATHLNKGIDISDHFGAPITAAQSGKVVYAGEGLRGYGKLIIIKHSEDFLSAYAHNHALLVKEGSEVATGQTIAQMGKSDTDQVKLHFEIRQNGKPIDPIRFLPPRSSE